MEFPSLKAKQFLAVLQREPLNYTIVRHKGSHRRLESASGYPPIGLSYHDGQTVPPGVIRKYLVKRIGLTEAEALKLL